MAAVTAIAIVFAVWAALGKGNWLIRYALLTFVLLGLGASLGAFCRYADQHLSLGRFSYQGYDWTLHFWLEVGWWWIAWMFLSGGLLAASLLIFRAIGYRLVKRR